MEKWHNKIAVVTKASEAIGLACCKALIDTGMTVVAIAKDQEHIEKLREQWPNDNEKQKRLHVLKSDMNAEDEIVQTIEKAVQLFGTIAVFINNAGIMPYTELLKKYTEGELLEIVNANMLGVAFCNREAFSMMSKNEGQQGYVIIINNIPEYRDPTNPPRKDMSQSMFTASEFAITTMTDTFRIALLKENAKIKVTYISPGPVRTTAAQENVNLPLLDPSDIADAVIYCLQTSPRVQIPELSIKPFGVYFIENEN